MNLKFLKNRIACNPFLKQILPYRAHLTRIIVKRVLNLFYIKLIHNFCWKTIFLFLTQHVLYKIQNHRFLWFVTLLYLLSYKNYQSIKIVFTFYSLHALSVKAIFYNFLLLSDFEVIFRLRSQASHFGGLNVCIKYYKNYAFVPQVGHN